MTQVTEPQAEKDRKPRWRLWRSWKWRWRIAAVLGALLLVGLIHFILGSSNTAKQMAAIRARGEPISMEELAAYYARPPAGQDATRLWMRGAQSIPTGGPVVSKLPYLGQAETPPLPGNPWAELALAKQFLHDNAQGMQDLHDAAALGGRARYPVTFDGINTISSVLSYVQLVRHPARCLEIEFFVRAHDGDMHGAAETLQTGLRLSQSLATEPIMVSQLVRVAVLSMPLHEFKRIGPQNFPVEDLERLQQALAEIDLADSLRRAMIGERAMSLAALDDLAGAGFASPAIAFGLSLGIDRSAFLKYMTEQVAICDLPWPEAVAEAGNVSTRLNKSVNPFMFFTKQIAPAFSMTISAFMSAETRLRLTTIEIAIARYQQQHGRPPADLAELAPDFLPEIPLDPASGNPFMYRTTEAGHVLYTPYAKFPMSIDETLDAETGAHPRFVYRWPLLPEPPKEAKDAPATENAPAETPPASSDEQPGDEQEKQPKQDQGAAP